MNKTFFYHALSALFVGGMAFAAVSCADDDLAENTNNGDTEAAVRFDVSDSQEDAQTRGALTRGAITPGLTDKDLDGKKLAVQSSENLDVCLIETTVEGVNPVKLEPGTRANITTLEKLTDFSSTGVRGTAANAINKEWFNEEKTRNNGILYNARSWSWLQPHGRFYAVSPESTNGSNGIKFTKPNGTAAPSLEFTVNTDVRKQVDLMTACSDNVHYATRFQAPRTNLQFRHALTAIRFAVGQNLSFNKTIKDITLKNVLIKSKYTLSNKLDGTGAAWNHSGYNTRGKVTLSNVNYNTNENANSIVRDRSKYNNSNETNLTKLDDNYTFYMIPQELTGKGVTVYVHCTDGTTITAPLKGEWKAGTTRTYKLSQTNSNWNYVLTATDPTRAAEYDETTSQAYTITSYRENSGTRQAVPWKVIGYDADNDGTFTMAEKPAWLTALSSESGSGGTSAEAGTATLTKDVKDLLKERNDRLKNATAVGSASAPYDLSLHNYQGATTARNTANSYLISAPGHYRIPLVYGNAIKNGATNSNAYETTATGTYVLQHFKDHNNQNITDPWIEKSNAANAGIDGAKIVWADEQDLVHLSASPIKQDGGNAYLDFEVKQADITSGNAVVAVTKNGTVVWSWHLWFAPKSALNKIEVTNHQSVKYNFTEEALGWKPTVWRESTYNKPRAVKVKVEQTIANSGIKQIAEITIIQNPGIKREGICTVYQFGRKDAFPGTDALAPGSTFNDAGNNMSIVNSIQHPGNFYSINFYSSGTWYDTPPAGYTYYNLWSAENTTTGFNDDNVVKTVYDPSPVGFKMPASNAFTGFTHNGNSSSWYNKVNADGTTDYNVFHSVYGHNFWTNSSKNATIFFPAVTARGGDYGGALSGGGDSGCYWTAVPAKSRGNGCLLVAADSGVDPLHWNSLCYAYAVRPASE